MNLTFGSILRFNGKFKKIELGINITQLIKKILWMHLFFINNNDIRE